MSEIKKYHSWLFKPKNFNILSIELWGSIIIDWQWAVETLVWKEYHESTKIS